jgi:protein phosphatase
MPTSPMPWDTVTGGLVVCIGVAGCGKSSWSARHFQATQVVCLDTLRGVACDDVTNQDATPDAVAIQDAILHIRLRQLRLTVSDATNVEPKARVNLLAIAEQHNVQAHAVLFDVPVQVCQQRQAKRPGPPPGARYGRRVPAQVIAKQHAHLQPLVTAPEVLLGEGFATVTFADLTAHRS